MLIVAALPALDAAAQTTNFTPRAPRTYTALAKVHNQLAEGGIAPQENALRHLSSGTINTDLNIPAGADGVPHTPQPGGARVIRRRPADDDGKAKPAPTLGEIAASGGRPREVGGVADEILKQQAFTRTVEAGNRKMIEDESRRQEEDRPAAGRLPDLGTMDAAAKMLSEQQRGNASLFNTDTPAGGLFTRNDRNALAPAPAALPSRAASPFDGGSPAYFGGAQQQPAETPGFRVPQQTPGGFGVYGAGDPKRPSGLPW